jgi:S-DNA-T family DNA segregation ATPase FtsK/SpoIIIE
MLEHMENATRTDAEKEEFEAEYDSKLPEAVDIAIDLGQVSISMLQRKMRIGYARAGRIIDEMSRRGIVSEADGSKPREVLITREQAHEMFEDCA